MMPSQGFSILMLGNRLAAIGPIACNLGCRLNGVMMAYFINLLSQLDIWLTQQLYDTTLLLNTKLSSRKENALELLINYIQLKNQRLTTARKKKKSYYSICGMHLHRGKNFKLDDSIGHESKGIWSGQG